MKRLLFIVAIASMGRCDTPAHFKGVCHIQATRSPQNPVEMDYWTACQLDDYSNQGPWYAKWTITLDQPQTVFAAPIPWGDANLPAIADYIRAELNPDGSCTESNILWGRIQIWPQDRELLASFAQAYTQNRAAGLTTYEVYPQRLSVTQLADGRLQWCAWEMWDDDTPGPAGKAVPTPAWLADFAQSMLMMGGAKR